MRAKIDNLAAIPSSIDEFQTLGSLRLNKGMITVLDTTDIPEEALLSAENVRIRYDSIERAPKLATLGPIVSTEKILGLFQHVSNSGISYIYRADKSVILRWNDPVFSNLIGTLSGSDEDRFRFVSFLDRLFFTNNGIQPIQEIDNSGGSFGNLGNADNYKYLTAFGNRLIGFNRTAPAADPTFLGWSGNGDPDEWDELVDISAGGTPLGTSPGDRSDEGTGVFGFTNVMLIIRQRSIWRASLQPVASRPFKPTPFIPGLGSDSPDSIVIIPNGLMFADTRTKGIYKLDINSGIENVGQAVENEIFRGLSSSDNVFASYDDHNKEYLVGVKLATTNEVRIWVYNLITKAWEFDKSLSFSAIASIEPGGTAFAWDEAVGTWDDATGSWDDAIGTKITKNTLYFGDEAGQMYQIDETIVNDNLTRIETKDYQFPDNFIHTARLTLWLSVEGPATLNVYVSKDQGDTWTLVKTKEYNFSSKRVELRIRKHIRAKTIRFRIEVSNGKVTYRELLLKAIASEGDRA